MCCGNGHNRRVSKYGAKACGICRRGLEPFVAPLYYAASNGIIDKITERFYNYDVVFVALPPEATVSFFNSNSFKDGELGGCIGFTGGSFQDMTRIAGVDEEVWASLYLLNVENLSENIRTLISSLTDLKSAIDDRDEERLKKLLREGRQRFASGKNLLKLPDISVQKIK